MPFLYFDNILVLMPNVVQYVEKYKKNIAVDMRKRGFSYSEIENRLHVPKSTLSWWLKDLPMTDSQTQRLKEKRLQTARANSEKRILKTSRLIEEVKNSSAKDIKKISKRELWLMGIMLYWKERLLTENADDLRKGVRFTTSDPYIAKLFLKWLQDIGELKDNEIGFDIFIGKDKDRKDLIDEVTDYWSDVTGFPKNYFTHIYFQIQKSKPQGRDRHRRKTQPRSVFGFLRIRVRASSMLARQISGWIRGIQKHYWDLS